MSDANIRSASFPELADKVGRIYWRFGQYGLRVFTPQAEAEITNELNKLGDFSLAQLRSEDIVRTALDPAVEAEGKQLVLNCYDTILRHLPNTVDPSKI